MLKECELHAVGSVIAFEPYGGAAKVASKKANSTFLKCIQRDSHLANNIYVSFCVSYVAVIDFGSIKQTLPNPQSINSTKLAQVTSRDSNSGWK